MKWSDVGILWIVADGSGGYVWLLAISVMGWWLAMAADGSLLLSLSFLVFDSFQIRFYGLLDY